MSEKKDEDFIEIKPHRMEKFVEIFRNLIKKFKENRCYSISVAINLIVLTLLIISQCIYYYYPFTIMPKNEGGFWGDYDDFYNEYLHLSSQLETCNDEMKKLEKFNRIPKSCNDLKYSQDQNRKVSNGQFFIELENEDLDPFQVYCDFEKNITIISPVTKQIEIGSLENITFGNLVTEIQYEASLDQIKALIKRSGSCYQTLHFDCFQMPLKTNDTNLAWWKDFKGRKHSFYDGSNRNVRQCSTEECNCNSALPGNLEWKFDNGKITADWLLPIRGFGYDDSQHSYYYYYGHHSQYLQKKSQYSFFGC